MVVIVGLIRGIKIDLGIVVKVVEGLWDVLRWLLYEIIDEKRM